MAPTSGLNLNVGELLQLMNSEHVLANCDWMIDIQMHVASELTKLMMYLGVEFPDGRLSEIACEATDTAVRLMLGHVLAGETREIASSRNRPSFCFWTPVLTDDSDIQPVDELMCEETEVR